MMVARQPLAPDNSQFPLSQLLFTGTGRVPSRSWSPADAPSILGYPQPGRQTDEGFGGGRIISEKTA